MVPCVTIFKTAVINCIRALPFLELGTCFNVHVNASITQNPKPASKKCYLQQSVWTMFSGKQLKNNIQYVILQSIKPQSLANQSLKQCFLTDCRDKWSFNVFEFLRYLYSLPKYGFLGFSFFFNSVRLFYEQSLISCTVLEI